MYSSFAQSTAFTLSVNFGKLNLTVNAAKAFNPNRDPRQKPQKGEKVYDWENSAWFSLGPTECQEIYNYMNGKPVPQNKIKDGKLHEVHGSDGNYNFFDFYFNGDKPCMSLGAGKGTVHITFNDETYNAFVSAINFILNHAPWYNDLLKEMGRIVAGRSSFNPGNDANGRPWSESNNSYNNSGNNYNPNNGDGSWSNNVSYSPNQDSGYQQPQGGYQKKQYSSNGYQKKQYTNNYNNGGNYQRNNYQPQANVQPPRPPQQAYQAPQNNVPPTPPAPPQPMTQPPVPHQPMNNNQPPVPPAPPVDFDMSM